MSLYAISICSIFFLPDPFWERSLLWCQWIIKSLNKLKVKNPWKKELTKGEELLVLIPEIEAKISFGLKTSFSRPPQYKFYTGLIFDLLEIHHKLGMSLKHVIPDLRVNLIKDLQFEKKLTGHVLGANMQFIAIIATTWLFIFLSSSLIGQPVNVSNGLAIFCLQLMGFGTFHLVSKQFKSRVFLKFDQAIERLYLFVGLVEVGKPVSEILSDSQVLEGDLHKYKLFLPIAKRLYGIVERWKESGMSPKSETKEIIAELWHQKEMSFEHFLKHLDLLKFSILAFFFLPAYFLYLYSIFQFFMEQ